MKLIETKPNPNGGIHRLFLLQGDAVAGPSQRIENHQLLPESSGKGRLHLLHFNDLHNHLTELSGETKGTHRFSQMVQRVKTARRHASTNDAVLFLSCGDDHTGSVFDELLGWRLDQFVLDASYRVYSQAGIDVSVLGNHEFDRGAALLAAGVRQDAKFPILSANAHSSEHLIVNQDYFPAAIAIAGDLKIGMIGLTTHIETRVGQPNDPNFAVASPLSVIRNLLPALAPLVDVVLILSHCGFGEGAHKSGKSAATRDIGEADFSIARTVAGLTDKPTLVLGAHTHTKLNENGLDPANIFDGVPVFQAECNGRYIGEIDLQIGGSSPAGYDIHNVCLHRIKPFKDGVQATDPDKADFEQAEDFDAEFETEVITPLIKRVENILTNKIASVTTDNLSFKAAVFDRYTQESPLLNFMCDAVFHRLDGAGIDVDFVLMNGATVQAGVEPGALNMGAWFDVMPYADEIFMLQITGDQLVEILHSNAKRILRPEEVPFTDYSGFLSRGFLHTSRQIRYQIDPEKSAQTASARRISVSGQPVSKLSTTAFNVAVPTYLALGAFGEHWNGRTICGGVPGNLDGYDMRDKLAKNTGLVFRDEIAAHILATGIIDETAAPTGDGRLQVLHSIESTG